jgi:hypothetical protein
MRQDGMVVNVDCVCVRARAERSEAFDLRPRHLLFVMV